MAHVVFNTNSIIDWDAFHDHCAVVFGFPEFYGRNMNAWIDCLTYLSDDDRMSRFNLGEGEQLFIHIVDFEDFSNRVPDISSAFMKCTAFVNCRNLADANQPKLVLVLE